MANRALLIACGLGLGCKSSDAVDFPAKLSPLEDNLAPAPVDPSGEAYPEVLAVVSGGDDDLWWAHARGYLRAPVGLVWQSSQDIDVCVDRREVDAYTSTDDTVPEFDVSYTIHVTVDDVITVNYDTTWAHELQAGTEAAPERVVAQWDKTDGTVFIDLLAGSMVLLPVDEGVTEIQLIEHLQAALRDDATIARYLEDYFADLLARVHGEPLPTLE